jgi:hypothetical protein
LWLHSNGIEEKKMSKETLYKVAEELGMDVEDLVLEAIEGFNDQNKYGISKEGYAEMVRLELEFNNTHGEPTRGIRLHIERMLEMHKEKALD